MLKEVSHITDKEEGANFKLSGSLVRACRMEMPIEG
jgi:hypothetical protein